MSFEIVLATSKTGARLIRQLYLKLYFDPPLITNNPYGDPCIVVDRTDVFMIRCVKSLIKNYLEYRQNLMIFQINSTYADTWSIRTTNFTVSEGRSHNKPETESFDEILIDGQPRHAGHDITLVHIPESSSVQYADTWNIYKNSGPKSIYQVSKPPAYEDDFDK